MVRTPHSHCQGLGSTPGQGTKTPQAAWHGQRPQRDLPAVLPIGLTLGWSPGGMAMVQHEKCHRDLPKWREYESQHPEPHTNVDLNHSKTDCHPQPRERGSGIMQPLPTALQTPKTSRSTSETPPMANSRGSSGGALGQSKGTQHMGMSKHHQSLGRPLELGLS